MPSFSTLLFALAFSAGTIASLPCVCANDSAWMVSAGATSTCSDRYNALLANAKAALAKGDQHAALHGLLAARSQLRSCEERDNDSAPGAVAIALNSQRLTGCGPLGDYSTSARLESAVHQTRAGSIALSSSAGSTRCPLFMRSISWSIS